MKGEKETIYFFFLSILSKFATYFLLLALANLYIQSEYGKASFVLSIFNIIYFFTLIGLPNVFVPWYIKNKDTSSIFYFLSILTLIATFAGIIISFYYPWILPIVLALPFLLFNLIGKSIFRAQDKYHILEIFQILYILITFLGVISLKDYGKLGILTSYSLGYILTSIAIFYLAKKEILQLIHNFKLNFLVILDYLKKAFSTSLIALSFGFLGWIDSTILGLLSTFENVARYNIAGPISTIITAVPLSLSMFLLTKSAKIKDNKKTLFILKKCIRISIFFSLLVIIILTSLISIILKIFFPIYADVGVYAMILFIGILFYAIYLLQSTYLMGKLKPEKILIPILTAAILNIILDILLIPKFQLYGICLATAFSHFIAFTMLTYKMKLFEFYKIYILIPLIPISFFLGYYGLLLILLTIPLLFLFKLIQKQDLLIIKNIIFEILHTSKIKN